MTTLVIVFGSLAYVFIGVMVSCSLAKWLDAEDERKTGKPADEILNWIMPLLFVTPLWPLVLAGIVAPRVGSAREQKRVRERRETEKQLAQLEKEAGL